MLCGVNQFNICIDEIYNKGQILRVCFRLGAHTGRIEVFEIFPFDVIITRNMSQRSLVYKRQCHAL
jgi:hypothetical protein